MNLESGTFRRCVNHPTQIYTGFCSSCLAERLSTVQSVERVCVTSNTPQTEIVEISEVRVRKTLLSLFQLDDCSDSDRQDHVLSVSSDETRPEMSKDENSVAKGLRWGCLSGDREMESRSDLRHSCDWRACRESSRSGWDKPRHSWDGSMVSKALTCSFACLEVPHDGSCRIRKRLPEEGMESNLSSGTIDDSKENGVSSADEKPSSCREISGLDVSRRRSNRWSRVWDWSVISPFKDFVKKRDHVLERSLSESWQEARKDNGMGTVESDSAYVNGVSTARTNQGLNRSTNGINGEIQNFRHDWQRKRECRFGRSRSVHYQSPGNVDNGLLRFYLTPMRTSRRSSNKGRMKTSRSFARSILGLS